MKLLSRRAADLSSDTEHRRATRRAVGMRVFLRDHAMTRFEADIVDLSTTGFLVETSFGLCSGSRVWLMMPELGSLEAAVARRDRYRYGCTLRVPLDRAVIDQIVARNWA